MGNKDTDKTESIEPGAGQGRLWTKFAETFQGPRKWEGFLYIVLGVLAVSTTASFVAKKVLFHDDQNSRPLIGVVADEATPGGKSIARGASLLADEINAAGGYKGRLVEAQVFGKGAAGAKAAVASGRLVAAVGAVDAEAAKAFEASKTPFEQVGLVDEKEGKRPAYTVSSAEEARFVANYARNIAQARIAYVVREEGERYEAEAKPFAELYAKFDTPIQKEFVLAKKGTEFDVDGLVAELKALDFGTVYIAASAEASAKIVSGMRKAGVALDLIGPSTLSSGEFQEKMAALSGEALPAHEQGIVAATPVLFDTAASGAQRFQEAWQKQFGTSPDWMGVLGRDAALAAMMSADKEGFAKTSKVQKVADRSGGAASTLMGIYSGIQFVSAPVQLLPMPKGAGYDYMEALKSGKVLYVNDRFMFKSNVVYAGAAINDISEIDTFGETATIDFTLWFRFKGNLDPKDLVFENALEPVKFAEPEEASDANEVKYRKYRAKAKFKLNFTDEKRAYGQHIAGFAFRHKSLNRSNMIFVSDVQGMPSGAALGEDMAKRRVAKPSTGWRVDGAWIGQSLATRSAEGAPQYIGHTGEKPQFSTIAMTARLKQDGFSPLTSVNHEWLVYMLITGFVGVLAAKALDARSIGRFMGLQSWLLRLIFMPAIIVGAGGFLVDAAYEKGSIDMIRAALFVSGSAWWFFGAFMANLGLRRFAWEPIEAKAGRKIPNVMKGLAGFLIYVAAGSGIVAVVLDKSMTSILAASGVLAMVVGLAVKANIANIFSGIVLNLERPFRVGDFVKIGSTIGQVKDITWRTIRLESDDGTAIIMPNSKVSEGNMENLSAAPSGISASTNFSLPPDVDPARMKELITEGAMTCKAIVYKDDPDLAPSTRFKGLAKEDGKLVAQFSVGYRVKFGSKKSAAREELWLVMREKFMKEGVNLIDETASKDAKIS